MRVARAATIAGGQASSEVEGVGGRAQMVRGWMDGSGGCVLIDRFEFGVGGALLVDGGSVGLVGNRGCNTLRCD